MKYTDNALNILTINTFQGIGKAWILKNLRGNESTETLVSLLNQKTNENKKITIVNFEIYKNQIKEKIDALAQSCDGLLAIGDKGFPKHRGNVVDSEKPIFIFYKGDINLLNIENSSITVIGLLNPDKSIESRERKLVDVILKNDVIVVSGLAHGCDTIAHEQAVIGGKTIAILPSPLNDILPVKNKEFANEIVEKGGLLISEYYEKFKSKMELSSRYKERDRLQALYCDLIILVASYAKDSAQRWGINDKKLDSGARLAMEYAKKYSIPRAVMYNQQIDHDNPMFDLNRKLIKEDNRTQILTDKELEKMISRIKGDRTNQYSQMKLF